MAQTYSIEFKEEACKRVQSSVPAAQVARELGINVNAIHSWISRFKAHSADPFVGSGPKACSAWRIYPCWKRLSEYAKHHVVFMEAEKFFLPA